jgi:hypothetical protein
MRPSIVFGVLQFAAQTLNFDRSHIDTRRILTALELLCSKKSLVSLVEVLDFGPVHGSVGASIGSDSVWLFLPTPCNKGNYIQL